MKSVGFASSLSVRPSRYERQPRRLSTPRRRVVAQVSTLPPQSAEELDFVTELKRLAMQLHTTDQAKSGEQKEAAKPFQQWVYTREGYLRFLVHSREVYTKFEQIVQSNDNYSLFRDTGLERVASLNEDIAWISAEYDLPVPSLSKDNPAEIYCRTLEDLSQNNEPAFVCHLYNFYLAHTAGGRMIGKKAADAVLSGAFDRLAFYKYDANVKMLVDNFKKMINTKALEWTREEKDTALNETPESFKCAGSIMRTMFGDED